MDYHGCGCLQQVVVTYVLLLVVCGRQVLTGFLEFVCMYQAHEFPAHVWLLLTHDARELAPPGEERTP